MVRAAAVLLVLLVAFGGTLLGLAACGGHDEPFAGLYWEPATGRRIEIREREGTYWLYYGVAEHPFLATRHGDELRIAEPLGGEIIVRPADVDGELELVSGGRTTRLKPLSQE